MALILGIETSCDETGVAVYDTAQKKIISHNLFSQIDLHAQYGGVVPEIASRSQLEKIDIVTAHALQQAGVSIEQIDTIAVTSKPGLAGSLLIGVCFAKGLAWAHNKKIIGIDHLEGHVFSSCLDKDGSQIPTVPFPHLCLSVSGGHTALYLVRDFGSYELIANTIDDAAGEAFDKVAKTMGLGYPGGRAIEQLAKEVNFEDFFALPRTKTPGGQPFFSFSGLKTAVLYTLVKQGAYDLATGPIEEGMTHDLRQRISSSLLVCIADIFCNNLEVCLKKYPAIRGITFVGGVACNAYLRSRIGAVCEKRSMPFFAAPPAFCTDNGAMIAFIGSYKHEQEKFSDLTLDIF